MLTQIHRDFAKAKDGYPADEFVRNILNGADKTIIQALGAEMKELVDYEKIYIQDKKALEICECWHRL